MPLAGLEPACHSWRQVLNLQSLPFLHKGKVIQIPGVEPEIQAPQACVLPLHHIGDEKTDIGGFEPPELLHPHAFQACAIGHSAIYP